MIARVASLALALTVLGGVAPAQDRAADRKPVAAVDPVRDVRGRLDVRRVALGRSADGKLRGEITLARQWGTADLRAGTGAQGSLCLRLYVKRDAESEPPDYLVCATPAREGDELVGRVLRDRANGLPRAVDEASISRPTGRTIFLRFSQTAIGKPFGVRFGAEAISRASGCPRPVGCRDFAPNAPRTMYLALRSSD